MNWYSRNIDRRNILFHLIFWIGWVVSFVLVQSLGMPHSEYFVWTMYYLITLPVFMAHTYLIAYWLIPRTFFRGSYLIFAAGIIVLLFVFSIIELIVSNELVFRVFDQSKVFEPGYLGFRNILISGIGNHYIIMVFLAIKAGRSWYNSENKKAALLQTKTETELEIYQYQLQPRLILTLIEEMEQVAAEAPEKSPDMIIKISAFLNKFLFEGKEELIPLSLDQELLNDFLSIHTHALGDRLKNNFVVSGNLKAFVIPPLILLPFINDAIKIIYKCNNLFESTVIIKAERNYLLVSFTFWSDENFPVTENSIMEITRKRLDIRYRDKYRLVENIDDNFREISLEIFSG